MVELTQSCKIVVMGVNYHCSPVSVRERFSISLADRPRVLQEISRLPFIQECVLLSTCNRTEVYALVSDVARALRELESFFRGWSSAMQTGGGAGNITWFKLLHEDAILHLLRVASGLDSMILGENQILAQVKDAFQTSLKEGLVGPVLSQMFKEALSCGKRVRNETPIARKPVSVSSAAIDLGRSFLGGLQGKSVLIVGAGKMASICVQHLIGDDTKCRVAVVNRSNPSLEHFCKAKAVGRDRLTVGLPFHARHELAAQSDLVIVSTSATEFVLNRIDLEDSIKESGKQVCIIDISVPRNVDPDIGAIPGVRLFHADNLADIVNHNRGEREAVVAQAEEIVFAEMDLFLSWLRFLEAAPTIKKLYDKVDTMRGDRLSKIKQTSSAEQAVDVDTLTRQMVNHILHEPTVQLRKAADQRVLKQMATTLSLLFNLGTV